jgi:hypothetical protein
MSLREGYPKEAERILDHLKTIPKGRIIVDITYSNDYI